MNIEALTRKSLAERIDHTQLRAYADRVAMEQLCQEAMTYGFGMVAVNSAQVKLCRSLLKGSKVHVGAAVSFPFGQTTLNTKLYETKTAIDEGADEIDYVINIGELKNGNLSYMEKEMQKIVMVCRENHVVSKVIFETCYLTNQEIQDLAAIACKIEPDFIKTSTGFGAAGATAEHVALMKQAAGEHVKVKAAGGIGSWESCRAMLLAGADRIGTSASVKILEEYSAKNSQS